MRISTCEADVLSACLDLLQVRCLLAWRSNNVGIFDQAKKRFRSFKGMKGVSDILCVLPGGRLLAIETKSVAGKLTEDQAWFLDQVNRIGGVGLCVRSVGELDDRLNALLVPQDAVLAERKRCLEIVRRLLANDHRAVSWHEVADVAEAIRKGE